MEERKIRLLDAEALWGYALKVLGGRAYSSGELREKLRRRAARSGDVDDILARLKDHGYLDDRRFAEGFAASRLPQRETWPHASAAGPPAAPHRPLARRADRERSLPRR